ncbi:hypothetical protein OAO87_01900 [bacterium]|nr:hypothetical protein [bacterium]
MHAHCCASSGARERQSGASLLFRVRTRRGARPTTRTPLPLWWQVPTKSWARPATRTPLTRPTGTPLLLWWQVRTKSWMQRGANLSFLSTFPTEAEYLCAST